MNSNEASGQLITTTDSLGNRRIYSLQLEIPATSLKSGKDGMDKNAYKALKSSVFNLLKFELKEAVNVSSNYRELKQLEGYLTIAGVKKYTKTELKIRNDGNYILMGGKQISK
jgi:polyisoprenoid-binding protein YceI